MPIDEPSTRSTYVALPMLARLQTFDRPLQPAQAHHALRSPRAPVLQSAQRLRFQVYCQESRFLPAADYPDGLETDEHDASAAHFYAFDTQGDLSGYVRLIRSSDQRRFPIESRCRIFDDGDPLPAREVCAEVSRLMVRADYRRRRGDNLAGLTATANDETLLGERRHEAPEVLMSLYRQMLSYSRRHDIRHWYAAMERPLARALFPYRCAFTAIGPQTDYYGPVTPYLAHLDSIPVCHGPTR